MNNTITQLGLMFIFLVGISLLLLFIELLYRRLELKGEYTRKLAHFTGTLSTITFPYIFESHFYVLAMALFFFLVLFISRNNTYLRSIHDIDRISAGSYFLPAAIYITYLIADKADSMLLFILPMLILAICDPAAGIMGINLQQYNHKIKLFGHELQKTWLGSLTFFVSCFIISIVALYFNQMHLGLRIFEISALIAFVTAIVEMLSWKGSDNLFIPLSALGVLMLFL